MAGIAKIAEIETQNLPLIHSDDTDLKRAPKKALTFLLLSSPCPRASVVGFF